MAQGRCAGCGRAGVASKIESHLNNCEKYNALYDPDNPPLLPEAEYLRWRKEDRSPEGRAAAKEERLAPSLVTQDIKRAQQETRWATPKDILAD